MQERRGETRYLCSDLVRLLWSEGPQRERDETVVLENISASGACVQAEVPVDENTRVRLVCGKQEFHGYVRSCYWRRAWPTNPGTISRSICSILARSNRDGRNRW